MEPVGVELSGSIGAYDIQRFLGCGGMGSVYAGRHRTLGSSAAIKVMHPHLARDAAAVVRFFREGRAAARVDHPHVVRVFDVGEHAGAPFLAMELVGGSDLGVWSRERHPMPFGEIAECLLGVVLGVSAIHSAGIVHRDLKPSNIRVAYDQRGRSRPKIIDFGISKIIAPEANLTLTHSNAALGTASYMAPEQLRAPKSAAVRSDIYALGVVLYECVTGRLPFRGATAYELMHAALTEPLLAPSALRPDVPEELDAMILTAMQRDPEARFGSAKELGRALLPFVRDRDFWEAELAHSATTEHPATARSWRPVARSVRPSRPSDSRAGGGASRTLGSLSGSARSALARRLSALLSLGTVVLGIGLLGTAKPGSSRITHSPAPKMDSTRPRDLPESPRPTLESAALASNPREPAPAATSSARVPKPAPLRREHASNRAATHVKPTTPSPDPYDHM